MKKLLLLSLIIISNSVTANVDKVFDNLKPFFPTIKTENISSSELEGFYEVVLTNPQIEVLYISLDGRYVIQGAVTDIELMANLSTKRINSEKIKILELEKGIVYEFTFEQHKAPLSKKVSEFFDQLPEESRIEIDAIYDFKLKSIKLIDESNSSQASENNIEE